jgi:hypothetical protein
MPDLPRWVWVAGTLFWTAAALTPADEAWYFQASQVLLAVYCAWWWGGASHREDH